MSHSQKGPSAPLANQTAKRLSSPETPESLLPLCLLFGLDGARYQDRYSHASKDQVVPPSVKAKWRHKHTEASEYRQALLAVSADGHLYRTMWFRTDSAQRLLRCRKASGATRVYLALLAYGAMCACLALKARLLLLQHNHLPVRCIYQSLTYRTRFLSRLLIWIHPEYYTKRDLL